MGLGLAIVLFVLDMRIDAEVYAHLDKTLGLQTRTVADSLHRDGAFAPISHVYDTPAHMDFFSLYGPLNELVLASPNSKGIPLPVPLTGAALPAYYDVRSPDGHQARALAINMILNGVQHVLVVATERGDWDASERRIHRTLIATIAIATAMVVGFSLLIVRGAFAPLMSHGALIARLDGKPALQSAGSNLPRELTPYAETIEGAFARLHAAIDRERRFSRDIAHELRTPLAEIRATSEVAVRKNDNAELRAGLMTAISATERMQRSVDTLLTLARFESQRDALALDPLDLVAVINLQVAAFHHSAQARNIAFDFHGPVSAWIHSDLGIIERILGNLLQNAIEYAPPSTSIRCQILDLSDGFVVSIDNEARGLIPADLDRFGARFWRKNNEGGTASHAGLGLALCFALAHNLAVRLEFELDDGRLYARLGPFAAL